MKDQYEAVRATSKKKGEEEVNLAYLTDGLKVSVNKELQLM